MRPATRTLPHKVRAMTARASTLLARALVGLVFGPVDRTVCRWSVVTHRGES